MITRWPGTVDRRRAPFRTRIGKAYERLAPAGLVGSLGRWLAHISASEPFEPSPARPGLVVDTQVPTM